MAKVIHCPASNGYCEDEYYCENCLKFYSCRKKSQQKHQSRSGNGECFYCKHLQAVTMGVECGIKKDR